MAYLHVQNRSAPTVEKILSRVQVGVLSMSAGGTDKGRLVLAASAVHCAAARAGLRGIGWVNFLETRGFVSQHRFNLIPADIQNGAVQPTLLGNAFQLGPFGHVLGSQTLDNDTATAAGDVSRDAMRPVFADTRLLGLHLGRALDSLAVTVRSPLTAGRDALKVFVLLVQSRNAFGQRVAGAITEHQRNGDATVNADSATYVFDVTVDQTPDADLPSKVGAGHGCFTNAAINRTGAAELDPTDLGQLDAGPFGVQLLNADIAPHEAESVTDTGFLELWKTTLASEEPTESRIQIFHGALLTFLADRLDEIKIGAQVFKLTGLGHIVQVVTSRPLIFPPVIDALIQTDVPDKAAHASKFQHRLMLFTRGFQSVCEAAKNHGDVPLHNKRWLVNFLYQ